MIPARDKPDGRRYKRIAFKRPIKFKVKGRDIFVGHLALDLSEGGLRFYSAEFIPLNTVMMVQIQLEEYGRVIELEGRVAWARANPVSDKYQLGLEFADSMALKRALIGAHIRSVQKEN